MRTLSLPDQTGNAGKILFTDGENIYWDNGGGLGDQTAIQFQDDGTNLGGSGTVDTVNFTGTGVSASRVGNTVTVNIDAATPAGADTQIQFNDGGVFGAVSDFTFQKTTGVFTSALTGKRYLFIDPTGQLYKLGDIDGTGNQSYLEVDDASKTAQITVDSASATKQVLSFSSISNITSIVSGTVNPTAIYISNGTNSVDISPSGETVFSFFGTHFDILPNTAGANTTEIRFLEAIAFGTNYIGFKAQDKIDSTVTYILPDTDPVTGQVLSATTPAGGISTLSWTTPTGGTVTSVGLTLGLIGTDISVSGSPVTGAGSFTLNIPTASAINRGALSSTDWSTFNSKIGGSGTAGQAAYFNGTSTVTSDANFKWDTLGILLNIGNGTAFTNTRIHVSGSVNSYLQNNIQNTNTGASASSDWVATADNGNDTTHYVNMGTNGSGGGGQPFTTANHAYLYAVQDTLNIGSLGSTPIIFYTGGGIASPVERGRFSGTASTFTLGVAGTTLGTLQVSGNTSGVVSIAPQAVAGTWTLTLPAVAGTANQMLGISSGGVNSEWKTFATGTAGTDFNIAHTANTVTFNIPDASASNRGLVTTGTQTLAGMKTFSTGVTVGASGTNVLIVGTTSLVYRTTNAGSNVTAQSGFDVDNSNSTAGAQMWAFDTTNGFIETVANGTRRIARIGINSVENVNTAGSESSAMGFYIKPPGGALVLGRSLHAETVSTTDATVTTLHTFTIPASTTYKIHASVTARRTGGAAGTAEDGAGYEIIGTYKNVGGTATLIGAVNALYTAEDQAGWDATFDVTGATVRCRVTGAVNNNINWKMEAVVVQVS